MELTLLKFLLLLQFVLSSVFCVPVEYGQFSGVGHELLVRNKRQFDLTVTAEHDQDGTDLIAEAIANLWKSEDGNTQVEGSVKVVHSDRPQPEKGGDDFRLSLKVVFT